MDASGEISSITFWSWVTGAFLLGAVLGIVLGVAGFIALMALVG